MASITPNPSPLSWKETAPGTFTRPLDTIERFFKWLADLGVPLKREHWGVSLAPRLSFPDSIAASEAEPYLRRAWLILSKQHPMLYARAEGNNVIVNPLDEDEWLKESLITHNEEHATVDSLFTSLEPAPIVRCHWLPGVGEGHKAGGGGCLDGMRDDRTCGLLPRLDMEGRVDPCCRVQYGILSGRFCKTIYGESEGELIERAGTLKAILFRYLGAVIQSKGSFLTKAIF